ncbi:MAG: hypothetical protein RL756_1737 [Pseudomonadota bacterium]|jgi:hypothetical protein
MTDDRLMLARTERIESTRDRLVNWARWSRTSRNRLHTCCSIEGRYRPERLTEQEEADRRTADDPIDVRDALAVFRAVNPANGFPVRFTLALSAEFIFRLRPDQFRAYMRRHGEHVREREYDELVRIAIHAAANALQRRDMRVTLDA